MTTKPTNATAPPSQRWAMGVRYHGADFAGWAKQRDQRTVQDCVEAALSRMADHPIEVQCTGRTDRGVHATAQVIHFNSHAKRSIDNWIRGTQVHLPESIGIHWIQAMPHDFHARYNATHRRYQYVICTDKQMAPGMATRVTHESRPLNLAAMQQAANHLLGEHDFSAFRGAGCQSQSSHRHVTHLHCTVHNPYLVIDVQANAFLLHMVRNIVGSLLTVGRGEASPDWMARVLASRDRRQASVTAPPDGLYLVGVGYPDRLGIGKQLETPWFLRTF